MTQMSGVSTFAMNALYPDPDSSRQGGEGQDACGPRTFLTIVASTATSVSARKATVISGVTKSDMCDISPGGPGSDEDAVETRAEPGVCEGAGKNADQGRRDEGFQPHVEERGRDADHEEWDEWREPQHQNVKECVPLEAQGQPGGHCAGAVSQKSAKGRACGQKSAAAADRGGDHYVERAGEPAEQEAADDRKNRCCRKREGDGDRVEQDEADRRQDGVVGGDPCSASLASPRLSSDRRSCQPMA